MKKKLRTAVSFAAALLLSLICAVPVYAQAAEDSAADEPRWVIGYALVILSVGVGLTAVCRMGRRGQDIRRTE
jgi:hypothetical protein